MIKFLILNSGIGRFTAEYLASKYDYVILAGVRKQSDAYSINSLGFKNLKPLTIDVTKHESIVRAVDEVKAMMKSTGLPLAAVVHNAGIYRGGIPAEFLPIDDSKRLFDINFFGVMDLTQVTLPLLRESKGRLIMISSIAGKIGVPFESIYVASKYALEGFSDALRREIHHMGISVSIIEPGMTKSALQGKTDTIQNTLIDDATKQLSEDLYTSSNFTKGRDKIVEYAAEPKEVAVTVEDALTSSYPKTRMACANINQVPVWQMRLLAWAVPDRLLDMIYSGGGH
jgi:NAD(P)-dependent dehydrogenase (short-subunit alcohol dehydrogenase family)